MNSTEKCPQALPPSIVRVNLPRTLPLFPHPVKSQIELGGEGDHIHVLFDAHPGVNLINFIKNIKSVSSRHMRKEYGDYLQRYLWGGEFWSDGSTIISVGATASIDVLITYIKNQGKADKP